jgi:hypothetical protein
MDLPYQEIAIHSQWSDETIKDAIIIQWLSSAEDPVTIVQGDLESFMDTELNSYTFDGVTSVW